MDSLGYAHLRLGHHQEATACYERALDLFRDLADQYGQSIVLTHLGDARQAAGDLDASRAARTAALAILDDLDRPDAEYVRAELSRTG